MTDLEKKPRRLEIAYSPLLALPPPSADAATQLPDTSRPSVLAPIPLRQYMALGVALLGAFGATLGAQMMGSGLTDIQGGLGVSADEASWINTVYPMAQIVAVPLASPISRALGMRRFLLIVTGLFLFSCFLSSLAHTLGGEIMLRVLQGLAGGSFGVSAFSLTLRTFAGRNLAIGFAALAIATTFPNALGVLSAGQVVEVWGWQAIYMAEVCMSIIVLIGVHLYMDVECFQPKVFEGLDWAGFFALAPGLALLVMVLSQGDRHFWSDSSWLGYALVVSTLLLFGFVSLEMHRKNPLVNLRMAFHPNFGLACLLNILFRITLQDGSSVVPRFLTSLQGYKNLELSLVFWLPALLQCALYVGMIWLVKYVRLRLLIALGFICLGTAAFFDMANTSISAADQFFITQLVAGFAPPLFLVPLLMLGTRGIAPQDGPSAGIFWNVGLIFGSTGSTALTSYLIRTREYFHSDHLTGYLSEGWGPTVRRIDGAAAVLGGRMVDDNSANLAAVSSVTAVVSRQSLVLALNDVLLVIAMVALVAALLVFKFPPEQKTKVAP